MKLCLISDSYPCTRPHGGVAVYTQTAARALCARGHEVHVLVRRKPGMADYWDKDFADGAVQVHYRKVHWLPVLGNLTPALGEAFGVARALRRLHRQIGFDLVEFPNFEGLGFVSQVLRVAPIVVRLHTSMLETLEAQQRAPSIGERFILWMERMSVRLARRVVTHSTPHRDRLAAFYGLHAIEVIPHGIEIPQTPATPDIGSPMVLSLGRLTARKGAATLLAAIPQVLRKVDRARFVLAGSGEDHPLAQQFRAGHPGIPEGKVTFRDFVADAEKEQLLDTASLYVSASVYESFGLPFVEAMARGVPVVGCATSAMNEIILHERTGLLVPPRDPEALAGAMVRLLEDPAFRTRMGIAAREHALAHYSAARMAERMEAWYQRVLR